MARVIKRYANRKLYDTQARRYVTLAETEALVRQGESVQVIDQSTGCDVTYTVLSKIVSAAAPEHEEAKKSVLIEMIKNPRQAMLNYVKQSVSAGIDTVSQVGERIEERIKGIIGPSPDNSLEDVVGTYVSTLSAIIDERVKATLAQMELPTRAEIERLERALQDIEQRLNAQKKTRAVRRSGPPRPRARKRSAARGGRGKE